MQFSYILCNFFSFKPNFGHFWSSNIHFEFIVTLINGDSSSVNSINWISVVYLDVQLLLAMPETKKEIRACKDLTRRVHRPAKRVCDSTGCVAVKATPDEPESRFCCFKRNHSKNPNTNTTLHKQLCQKLHWCLQLKLSQNKLRASGYHQSDIEMWQTKKQKL